MRFIHSIPFLIAALLAAGDASAQHQCVKRIFCAAVGKRPARG